MTVLLCYFLFIINIYFTTFLSSCQLFFYILLHFLKLQKRQIRFGLEYGLDVSVYAKPKIKDWDMKKIGLKMLEEGTL